MQVRPGPLVSDSPRPSVCAPRCTSATFCSIHVEKLILGSWRCAAPLHKLPSTGVSLPSEPPGCNRAVQQALQTSPRRGQPPAGFGDLWARLAAPTGAPSSRKAGWGRGQAAAVPTTSPSGLSLAHLTLPPPRQLFPSLQPLSEEHLQQAGSLAASLPLVADVAGLLPAVTCLRAPAAPKRALFYKALSFSLQFLLRQPERAQQQRQRFAPAPGSQTSLKPIAKPVGPRANSGKGSQLRALPAPGWLPPPGGQAKPRGLCFVP